MILLSLWARRSAARMSACHADETGSIPVEPAISWSCSLEGLSARLKSGRWSFDPTWLHQFCGDGRQRGAPPDCGSGVSGFEPRPPPQFITRVVIIFVPS